MSDTRPPSKEDDRRAIARLNATGDLTELGEFYVRRGGDPMVSRALRGRKLHRGRGKSEKIDGEARFIIAVRASTTPGLSKAEKYALVENCAKEFGIVDKDGNTTEKAFDLVAGKYPRTSRRAKTLCEENRSAEIKVR